LRGTLYIGVTYNLSKRVYEHKKGIFEGFTNKYSVHLLVEHEIHNDISSEIQREKRLKNCIRELKFEV